MKVKVIQYILLLGLLILSGCSKVQVSADYNLAKAPEGVESFTWVPEINRHPMVEEDPLLHDRILSAIQSSLNEKGYTFEKSGNFMVTYSYVVKPEIRSTPGTGYSFGAGSYGRHGGFGISTGSDIRQYNVGYLNIDLRNTATDQLFWRGTGTRMITTHSSPEKVTEEVNETVLKILSQLTLFE